MSTITKPIDEKLDAVAIILRIAEERRTKQMKLEEFEARQLPEPKPPTITAELVVDEEVIEESPEDDFNEALALLQQSAWMLGFFSGKELSGPITAADRERMGKLALEVMNYVCKFEVPS